MDPEYFDRTAALFKLDAAEFKSNAHEKVQLGFLKIALWKQQLKALWWMGIQESKKAGGGWLCDEPGVGKVRSMFLLCI